MPLYAASAAPHPGYVVGNWYSAPVAGAVGAGSALASGTVALVPFYLTKPITVSNLGCRITTASAGGNLRLAIYRGVATTGLPTGTAVVETGNIATDSTGATSAAVAASALLSPGLYFMAVNSDNATVVCQIIATSANAPSILAGSTTLANLAWANTAGYFSLTFVSAYGAFPDLTGQALTETTSNAGKAALVYMKAA